MAAENSMLQAVAEKSGFPEPALRFLLCVLGACPLAFIYRLVIRQQKPWVQHIFSTLCGLSICYIIFGLNCIHSFVNIVAMYFVLQLFGPTVQTVAISFVINMGYLWVSFSGRVFDDFMIDWSVPHCILCLRLIGLAWDYYDGNNFNNNELSDDMKTTIIKKAPSLLQMLGYSYFFGSFLVGPQFPIRKYLAMVEGTLTDADVTERSCILAGLSRLALGLLYGVGYAMLGPMFSAHHLLTAWFEDISFLRKLWFIAWFGKVAWFKYVGLFLLSEGSCIIAGLGYNGKTTDGRPQWDGVANMKIMLYETSLSVLQVIQSFHLQTSLWLVRYVYKRIKFLGNRIVSLGLSQMFLAVWHGYMPGYYVLFVFQFVYVVFEKTFISTWQAFGGRTVYDMPLVIRIFLVPALYLIKQLILGYGIIPLALLEWDKFQRVFTQTYYAPMIIVFTWDFVVYPLILHPLVTARTRKSKKAE